MIILIHREKLTPSYTHNHLNFHELFKKKLHRQAICTSHQININLHKKKKM